MVGVMLGRWVRLPDNIVDVAAKAVVTRNKIPKRVTSQQAVSKKKRVASSTGPSASSCAAVSAAAQHKMLKHLYS